MAELQQLFESVEAKQYKRPDMNEDLRLGFALDDFADLSAAISSGYVCQSVTRVVNALTCAAFPHCKWPFYQGRWPFYQGRLRRNEEPDGHRPVERRHGDGHPRLRISPACCGGCARASRPGWTHLKPGRPSAG